MTRLGNRYVALHSLDGDWCPRLCGSEQDQQLRRDLDSASGGSTAMIEHRNVLLESVHRGGT